ncbi:PTS transporter subunit IIC [Anaerococcus obesiensis]|uniref:PTS transporter subunit IIC n=1 Tax=Anaerococcus obesiensis TaxID=1287640 RepID=UPI001F4488B8|nr:PTS transporter subunit IIC [Anaerococcus obesiensis]
MGLLAQKKSFGDIVSGTFKTMLGYLVLSAGSSIIVQVLIYFGEILQQALECKE